jgi:hypothetical protein
LARTSFKVGRIGQKAPVETARLTGREPDDSISSSESLSDEVGDSSGVVDGEKFQKKAGARDFFLSIALSVWRGPWNLDRFLTSPPLGAGRESSLGPERKGKEGILVRVEVDAGGSHGRGRETGERERESEEDEWRDKI